MDIVVVDQAARVGPLVHQHRVIVVGRGEVHWQHREHLAHRSDLCAAAWGRRRPDCLAHVAVDLALGVADHLRPGYPKDFERLVDEPSERRLLDPGYLILATPSSAVDQQLRPRIGAQVRDAEDYARHDLRHPMEEVRAPPREHHHRGLALHVDLTGGVTLGVFERHRLLNVVGIKPASVVRARLDPTRAPDDALGIYVAVCEVDHEGVAMLVVYGDV
mmetsp:Transcript_58645/g.140718  ORF Transcript_58645/g.140718 Transcript_58645/m.140718 type:complete len:218 (+) Transcript_58645:981-1634(+)